MDSTEADMAAVMGFSSFTEMPKPKRQKFDKDSASISSPNNPNRAPLGQRHQTSSKVPLQPASDVEDQPRYASNSPEPISLSLPLPLGRTSGWASLEQAGETSASSYGQAHQSGHGEAHPVLSKSLEELTQQDLQILRKGVNDGDGRTVYFTQKFIEDPWSALKSSSRIGK
jgi:hypothetical protein